MVEKLYTINEVVEILKISRTTFYRCLNSGAMKTILVNGKPRITESELQRLMKGE